MIHTILDYMEKPALYAKGTSKFWGDGHISKGMLSSHLDSERDGATRNHAYVRQSVQWIATVAPAAQYPALLDLGCGPGIYAELFDEAGYTVTGLDLSERSVGYARDSAREKNRRITYQVGNYLMMEYTEAFDAVTLINYDFGVLSTENRALLLKKIHAALRPGGRLIFDVMTPEQYSGLAEYKSWEFSQGGFFSPEPHLCLNAFYRYDAQNTFLRQYIVVTESEAICHNVWDHTFTESELTHDLSEAGFSALGLYGDIAGSECAGTGKSLCAVAEKRG